MVVTLQQETAVSLADLLKLYGAAGWTAYTAEPDRLHKAVQRSLAVVTARDGDRLVGLIRAVGDGLTIIYIQDVLVLQAYRNRGIGSRLMACMIERYQNVRQKVLLTEEAPDVRCFYEKQGFVSCDRGSLVAFARLSH